MTGTSEYLAQALGQLKDLAQSQGLIVDASATYAINSVLAEALAKVEKSEGVEAFSAKRRAEFGHTAVHLAKEATNAANRDGVHVIGSGHIESAVLELRRWRFFPFTGD